MNLQRIRQLIAEDNLIKFYQSRAWRNLRQDALDRDNHECQDCKEKGKVTSNKQQREDGKPVKLEVHHIKEVKEYPELALVLENTKTVCVDCHNEEHGRKFGYSNRNKRWDDERW
jgi:5-methylcytosine-specific restriction enzyme A